MFTYLTTHLSLTIIFIIIILLFFCFLFIKHLQNIGLEKIRGKVYQTFLFVEHEFQYGDNEQKFEYVIQLARSSLPKPFNFFITENLLRNIIQLWFDLIKDLLDDGKMNNSIEK